MLAFSEGVLLAERGGIDPALAVRVMAGSAIGSPMLQARAPLVLDLLYGPVYHRLLHGHAPLDEQFIRDVVDTVLDGIAPRTKHGHAGAVELPPRVAPAYRGRGHG